MAAMSRRTMIMDILPGAAVAVVAVGTVGWAVAPETADAMPLGLTKGARISMDDEPVHQAQAVVVGPRRRRRRRWVCWWRRGRRVCGWR
jgi:hypothetical protein